LTDSFYIRIYRLDETQVREHLQSADIVLSSQPQYLF